MKEDEKQSDIGRGVVGSRVVVYAIREGSSSAHDSEPLREDQDGVAMPG